MRIVTVSSVVAILFLIANSGFSAAQDLKSKVILQEQLGAIDLESKRECRDNIRNKVETMTTHAAALRSEFKFDEALIVEEDIRKLCWEYDPRVKRTNELKRRASDARLQGKIFDAELFEHEAARMLQNLKREYAGGNSQVPHPAASGNNLNKDSELFSEVEKLRAQIDKLADQLSKLEGELRKRDTKLSQLR